MKKTLIIIIVTVLIAVGIFYFYQRSAQKDFLTENVINNLEVQIEDNNQTPTRIANPASDNCLKLGGNLIIKKRGDGGEYGLCYFEDNRACEEWALFHGDCPVGGLKTTGLDTIDQEYCVWLGGELSNSNSVCIFKNSLECSIEEFYNGECPDSFDSK
ncbi:MAG: DUF333 domain-containing protein [Patescibacteria group bacterium]